MTMVDQPLLFELCTICHDHKPKYRCPRCRAQTCSLECYRRHQQRASCNGKRDPAAYVKKTKWATPSGIDCDYNYLRGLERTIQDASQQVHGRGIGVEPSKSKVALRAWQPASTLQSYLSENRITIQHAPKGMSRQKQNHTRATKNGNIVWTVEWADSAGSREVQHDCPASDSIKTLHSLFQTQIRNAAKRRLHRWQDETSHSQPRKKRQRDRENASVDEVEVLDRETRSSQATRTGQSPQLGVREEVILATGATLTPQDETSPLTDEAAGVENLEKMDRSASPLHLTPDDGGVSDQPELQAELENTRDELCLPGIKSKPDDYFYLQTPNTTGSSRVLIHLDSETSLTDSLRDQLVQEYPTIYVMADSPANLPAGFLLEEQYEKTAQISKESFDVAKGADGSETVGVNAIVPDGGQAHQQAEQLDPKRILDMLKRDIRL